MGGEPACLVNTLDPRVFRGEGPSSYSRPGRIPGSVNVPTQGSWTRRRSASRTRRVPAGAARLLLRRWDLREVGVFAAALAGRGDARLYDGSLTEWTADPLLPVEVG